MAGSAQPTIVLDVGAVASDIATIDCLARFQLRMRRRRQHVQLRHASDDLRRLIDFVGLGDVLGVETVGQAEEREQPLGVEEERELDDPPA